MTTLRPIDSFRQYFLDVKPYHTKILEVVEKYNFQEDLALNFEENIFFNIEYKNDPLCKTVGYGFVWDADCGFDSVDCCDLFDCLGGYGLIFDNSDLVASLPINTLDADVDTVSISGNHVYDVKTQIDSIPTRDTIIINGDLTPYFAYHKIFVILPVRTLNAFDNTAGEIRIKGNYAAELVNEQKFKLYNTSVDDGLYNVIQAEYDSIQNLTTITLADSQQVTPNLTNAIVEYRVGTKNNGAYMVDDHSFDGVSTTITLNSTTYASFTNTTEGRNHGSIQLRTGMVPGRYIDIETGTASDGTYKILRSDYIGNANETIVHLASDVIYPAISGWIRMYGYINQGGFDGDGECSTPKHSNIKVGISERLVIEVSRPPPLSPTPTPTVTPTVTPTPTASPIPAYTTTGKAIEGYTPDFERYERPELWQTDNGSLFTFACFMRAPTQVFQFNATFFRDQNLWFYLRRWNEAFTDNGFLLYIQDAAGDQWVGEALHPTLAADEWFAFMMSVDYSAVGDPTVEIWVHKVGDAAATDVNIGPLWAADPGPLTFSFDDNTTVASVGAHPIETGNYLNIDMSEVYLTNEFVDWSNPVERAKFVDGTGKPVGLGVDGSALTGTIPKHYAPDGDLALNNVGSENNWTEVGTILDSATSPTD